MAMTTTWSILKMERNASDGAVETVYWECRVQDDTHTECTAVEGGKLRLEPADTEADDFIAYDDLLESDVLGWIYNSLIEEDESADEARVRIETDRQAKVTAQVSAKTAKAEASAGGMPWDSES